jgi:hypothetical protein
MKINNILLFFSVCILSIVIGSGLIHGDGGTSFVGNVTLTNSVINNGDGYVYVGINFADNFNDLDSSAWTSIGGTWDTSNSYLRKTAGASHDKFYTIFGTPITNDKEYWFSFTFKNVTPMTAGANYIKFNTDNPSSDVTAIGGAAISITDTEYKIYNMFTGASRLDASASLDNITDGQNHTIMIRFDGGDNFELYTDGISEGISSYITMNATNTGIQLHSSITYATYDNFRYWIANPIGNFSINYTSGIGVGEELKLMSYDGNGNVSLFASVDNVTFVSIQESASNNTPYGISGNGYNHTLYSMNSADINTTDIKILSTNTTIASSCAALSINSYTPSTPNTEYKNVNINYTLTTNQNANVSWYVDSIFMQSNISVSTSTYSNSTMLNGSLVNITAVATNENGTVQQQWNQTILKNSFIYTVINETQTLVWFNLTNYTSGLIAEELFILWSNRVGTTGNTSTLYYQNGTSIMSNSTYVDGNVTLIPRYLIPEETYYIEETTTTTIETFVVAAGAFVAVVVAGAAVVSRCVRRGIKFLQFLD